MDMYGGIGVRVCLYRHLRSLHHRFHKRVVVLLEDKRETHLQPAEADIVFEHSALYQVFSRPRIAHMAQSVYYLLWVHIAVRHILCRKIDQFNIRIIALLFRRRRIRFMAIYGCKTKDFLGFLTALRQRNKRPRFYPTP